MNTNEYKELLESFLSQKSELTQRLSENVIESSFGTKSRLPFKVKTLEAILIHRIYELCESVIILHNENKELGVLIITRSILETSSILFWLASKIGKIVELKDLDDFDTFLMRNIFGTKAITDDPESYKPYNIMTAIDKVEKVIPGFRKNYDILCDYTHPNNSGGMFAFSNLDIQKGELKMKNSYEIIPEGISLNTLNALVALCNKSLAEIEKNFHVFTEICENAANK